MTDGPRFPSADEAAEARAAARSAYRSSEGLPAAEPRAASRVVVRRAEPLAPGEGKVAPKLTPEEVRALLAVDAVDRPPPVTTFFRRGRLVVIPTALIGLASHLLLGAAGPYIEAAVVVGAFVWAALPLVRRDGWS